MLKLPAELLGRFFLAFADLSTVNHHVVVIGGAIDLDRAERKCWKRTSFLRSYCTSNESL